MINFLKKILIFIFFGLIGFSYWIKRSFGDVTVDQLLFHVFHTQLWELAKFQPYFRNTFLVFSIVIPLLVLLAIYLASKKIKPLGHLLQNNIVISVLGIASIAIVFHEVSLLPYIQTFLGEDYFVANYLPPQQVKIQPQQKKNLIYIYVESMENTYRDANLMGRNLLQKIDTLKNKYPSVEFTDYNQIQGAHWTIASMVSTQCGVPLRQISATKDNDAQPQIFGSYLANAKCMNDILKEQGYTNHYIQGTYIGFAGTYEFYKNHSTDKVYGDLEWSAVYPQFAPLFANQESHTKGAWTSNDDQVFVYARLQVDELEAKKQPYNLMISTYDTHPDVGFLSPTCAKKGVKPEEFEKILECTQDEVVSYIDYLASKGYLKNTQVVIQGDHLTMTNPLTDKINKAKHRTVYNLLIGDFNGLNKANDHINHFDMLPTTLDFIGLKVEGGRAGLGYSAFNPISANNAQKRNEEMQKNVLNYSKAYIDLWTGKKTP